MQDHQKGIFLLLEFLAFAKIGIPVKVNISR